MLIFTIFEEFGSLITSRFRNAIIKKGNGGAENNIYWADPLLSFDFSKAIFYQDLADYLYDFADSVKGTKEAFLYLDPSDYIATATAYDTELGVTTRGVLFPLSDTEFQLYKLYQLGNNKSYRAIAHPIIEGLTVYIDDVETAFLVEPNTGKITLENPPPTDAILTWSGQFYVPVRFESEENIGLVTQVYDKEQNETIYQLPNVKLVEVKEIINQISPNNFLDLDELTEHLFTIDFSYDSLLTPIYTTTVTTLDSGFEKRIEQGSLALARVRLGSQNLYWNQIQYLIGLWRVCYGNAIAFTYPEYTGYTRGDRIITRFLSTDLNIKVERDDFDEAEKLFSVDGLELQQVSVETDKIYYAFGTYRNKQCGSEYQLSYWRSTGPLLGRPGGITVSPDNPVYSGEYGGGFRVSGLYNWSNIAAINQTNYEGENTDSNIFGAAPYLWYVYSDDPCVSLFGGVPAYGYDVKVAKTVETVLSEPVTVRLNEVNTLCHAWLIKREDGTQLGATDHDRTFTYDGVTYYPQFGYSASALKNENKLDTNNSELDSIIDLEAITEQDLLLGKYESATIEIWVYDWMAEEKITSSFTGTLGELKVERGLFSVYKFSFETQSLHLKLTQKSTFLTSKTCRLTFGETGHGKCNKDLTGLTDSYTISEVISSNEISVFGSSRPDGFYDQGTVTFASGLLDGATFNVLDWDGTTFTFFQPMPFTPEVNDAVIAVAGCEHTLVACDGYDNVENYGGQPYVPGIDRLIEGSTDD